MVSSGISNNIMAVRPAEPMMQSGGKTEDSSFEAIMMQSFGMAGQDMTSLSAQSRDDSKPEVSSQDISRDMSSKTKMDDRKVEKKPVKNEEPKAEVKKSDSKAKIEDKLEEVSEEVTTIFQEVREMLQETFGVTDEEINQVLDELGITMAEAMVEPAMTDFVVALAGMESSVDLLFEPDLMAGMEAIKDTFDSQMSQLMEDYDIEPEMLNEVLEAYEAMDTQVEPKTKVDVEIPQEMSSTVESVVPKQDDEKIVKEKDDFDFTKVEDTSKVVNTTSVEVKETEEKMTGDSATKQDKGFTKSQEGPQTMVEGFANNLTNAVNEAFEAHNITQEVSPVQIVSQIMDQIKVTVSQSVTSMEMILNPENLGKVNLNISVKENMVTASFVAQNEEVKAAIENQIVQLKETLNNQGLKVEAVEVTVESHAFEANANQNNDGAYEQQHEENQKKTQRSLRIDSLDDLAEEELTEEERIVVDMMKNEGNQVNFKA